MLKPILILISSLFILNIACAQKKETVSCYIKKSGQIVSTKDSADYILVIQPPDTAIDKNLFRVQMFYKNGKIRLLGGSVTNTADFKFQGSQIVFFPKGHKMRISNYENGETVGDVIAYYPNGKLYNIKNYSTNKKVFLKQCNDSTGSVLTQDGNGKWINFLDEDFSNYITGDVKDGLAEGSWHGKLGDTLSGIFFYNKGELLSSNSFSKGDEIFTSVDVVPQFPGGLDAFWKFLGHTVRYPVNARVHNIQGRVIISFVVERDGSLSNIQIARSVGGGIDEEALRVMKLSPRWDPGTQNGKPVRVAYSVPISFTLSSN